MLVVENGPLTIVPIPEDKLCGLKFMRAIICVPMVFHQIWGRGGSMRTRATSSYQHCSMSKDIFDFTDIMACLMCLSLTTSLAQLVEAKGI